MKWNISSLLCDDKDKHHGVWRTRSQLWGDLNEVHPSCLTFLERFAPVTALLSCSTSSARLLLTATQGETLTCHRCHCRRNPSPTDTLGQVKRAEAHRATGTTPARAAVTARSQPGFALLPMRFVPSAKCPDVRVGVF